MKDYKLNKRLLKYMKPYIKNYILALILMLIIVISDIISPYLISVCLNELGNDIINFNNVILLASAGLLLVFISNIIQYYQTMLVHKTSNKIIYSFREDVFSHIQTLSHHQFSTIPVGTLVTRDTSDVNVLYELYTNVILNIIKYSVTLVGVLIMMFILNYQLALITVCIIPIIVGLTIVFRIIIRKVHREQRTEVSNMNAFLSENISGMKVTQIFNQEEKKYKEFEKANNKLKKASLKEIFVFSIFRPSVYFIYISTVVLIIYIGGNLAINYGDSVMTYSILYAFYMYIGKFFNPIQSLADQFNTLQSAFASAEKVFSILDIESEIKDEDDAIDMNITGNIEFKNVWFTYNGSEWILQDVSFLIKAKEVVAFVGATGAGKSTILSLITRNYDIQKGQILIDGVDIKKIKLECLRRQIGQMLQDPFLFSGTIASNIRLDDDSITDDEILTACKEVNANVFIDKLPDGINTHVGERGNNLSLGEKQLVSFARTLVYNPSVMILDETTANIDTQTEKIIQDSLERVIKNSTMLMVAHRLSTIQHANMIYVFDHGHIIEKGTHQELLKIKGKYYQLYMLQFQRNQL